MNCAFSGLEGIPFGDLSCQLVLGGWTDFFGIVEFFPNPVDPDVGFPCALPGVSFGPAPGELQNYKEYTIDCEKSSLRIINTTIDFGIPLQYQVVTVYFSRAKNFYITKGIIPNMLFAYLSFGMFLMDVRSGERLR